MTKIINRHHLVPKIRGGKFLLYNTLRMKIHRHRAYHQIFGTLTWTESAHLLYLLEYTPQLCRAVMHTRAWKQLFGDKGIKEAIELMKRVWQHKQLHKKRYP